MSSMPRSKYAGRMATLYFRSEEELKVFAEAAQASGCSLSTYILETVGKAQAEAASKPPADLSRDVEDMKTEIRTLRKESREKELLLEHYETELFKLRNQAFSVAGSEGKRTYDVIPILKRGQTVSSYKLLQELGVDPEDAEAVRLISNQLEELRRFGLLKETANGWRWLG